MVPFSLNLANAPPFTDYRLNAECCDVDGASEPMIFSRIPRDPRLADEEVLHVFSSGGHRSVWEWVSAQISTLLQHGTWHQH